MFRTSLVALMMLSQFGAVQNAQSQTVPFSYSNIIQRPGLRIQCFGDSRCANEISYGIGASFGQPAGSTLIQYNTNGPLVQAMHMLGGRVNFDYTAGWGPCPYNGGACIAIINQGGSGYITPPVVTEPGCPGTTFGPAVIQNGVVISVPITGATGTCPSGSGLVFTGGNPASVATGATNSGSGGTWGFLGNNSNQMVQLLPRARAALANIDVIEIACCVNDVAQGISVAQTMTNWIQIITSFISDGHTVLISTPAPIGQSGGFTATNQQQVDDQTTRMIEWARGWSQQRVSGPGSILVADIRSVCGDQVAGATDGFVAKCTTDSVHLSPIGADIVGTQVIAPMLQPLLGPNSGQWIDTYPIGVYSANNPTGALSVGNFYSITGSGANAPFTGPTPLNWYTQQYAGSGSFVTSAENVATCADSTRSDCLSGTRLKMVVNDSTGGTADQGVLTPFAIAVGSLPVTVNVDTIYQEILLELSAVTNLSQMGFSIVCQNGSGTALLTLSDAVAPPNSNTLGGPQAGTKLALQTPRGVCPLGTTQIQANLGWTLNAPAGFTALMSNYAMRKVL